MRHRALFALGLATLLIASTAVAAPPDPDLIQAPRCAEADRPRDRDKIHAAHAADVQVPRGDGTGQSRR